MAFSPKAAADACIARSKRFLNLANLDLTSRDVSDDLCRFALVTAVAAVDAYMHWLVFVRLSAVRHDTDLPKSLARLEIPFADLAALADAFVEAQQDERAVRPWVQVKNTMQKQLLLQTFQSYDQVGNAFALAGVEKAWAKETLHNLPKLTLKYCCAATAMLFSGLPSGFAAFLPVSSACGRSYPAAISVRRA